VQETCSTSSTEPNYRTKSRRKIIFYLISETLSPNALRNENQHSILPCLCYKQYRTSVSLYCWVLTGDYSIPWHLILSRECLKIVFNSTSRFDWHCATYIACPGPFQSGACTLQCYCCKAANRTKRTSTVMSLHWNHLPRRQLQVVFIVSASNIQSLSLNCQYQHMHNCTCSS